MKEDMKESKRKLTAAKRIHRMTEQIMGLLYPHTCPFCGRVTAEDVCLKCADNISLIREPRCARCGKPIDSETKEYCYDCAHTHHYYDRGYALWLHKGEVSDSVYRFKYHNQRIYGRYYAREFVKNYGAAICGWNIGVIIPIPLYKKRRRERGFNQAEILAQEIGKNMNLPVDTNHLVRVRNTNPQKTMDIRKRRQNLRKAFALSPDFKPPANVLLIDDIYTTGNTIDSAARVLKKAGVQKVYFLTISIGQGY